MGKTYYVYILASRSRNLYAGVTNDLMYRTRQHREVAVAGFTSRYRIFRLVHYEMFGDIRLAIAREKEIKGWRREKKVWLIERENPTWEELGEEWFVNEQRQKGRELDAASVRQKAKADPSPPSKLQPGSG